MTTPIPQVDNSFDYYDRKLTSRTTDLKGCCYTVLILIAIVAFGLLLSCRKEPILSVEKPMSDVYFVVKSNGCAKTGSYVLVRIDAVYYVLRFHLTYNMTCPIQLEDGVHRIGDFRVFNDNNTLTDLNDDVLVGFISDVNTNPKTIIEVRNGTIKIEINVECKN